LDGNLLTQNTLIATNLEAIDYFVTCRQSFEMVEHKCHLATNTQNGNKGRTTKGFKYKDLLEYLQFKKLEHEVPSMKMNGARAESGGMFYFYKVLHKHGIAEEAMDV
jgi:hypothetical protein